MVVRTDKSAYTASLATSTEITYGRGWKAQVGPRLAALMHQDLDELLAEHGCQLP